jgi:hypothetical protein
MEEGVMVYPSEFMENIFITVVYENNVHYPELKKLFDQYGYGFLFPEMKTIIVDGEMFGDGKLSDDDLKFIEAHEIAHIMLNHDGPRNEEEELDADLGAYILLKQKDKMGSIKSLIKHFKQRHGIKFDENLLKRVKKYF